MEQKVINGVEMVVYCDFCKTDDHHTWRCPDLEAIPFGPMDEEDLVCEACGAEDEHWTDVCPKQISGPPEPEPGFRECLICGKLEDSLHWTEDCPKLADGNLKFCWTCRSLADHSTDDCDKFVQTAVIFCACCETTGDHSTEDCPREAKDGRKYCGICDWLGDHTTDCCLLK